MKLPAIIENLRPFIEYVNSYAVNLGFNGERANEVELVVEEALVNIIRYAYPKQPGFIELKCQKTPEQGMLITIEDEGVPFDFTSLPTPDLHADITTRRKGGLGIFFIRKIADKVHYRRDGNRNVVSLVLNPGGHSVNRQTKHNPAQT